MGAVVSKIYDGECDLCWSLVSRVHVLEERVDELEAMRRHSQSLGLSVCCAGHDRRSKAVR